jgi:hypothetical protein
MNDYVSGIQDATNASIANAYAAVYGANYGLQHLAQGASSGMSALRADMGGLASLGSSMPMMGPMNMHPMTAARHGMYAQEMGFFSDISSMLGFGTPETTTKYEYQQAAAQDFGDRVGRAVGFGGLYATGSAASWVGGGYMLAKGASTGYRMARFGTTHTSEMMKAMEAVSGNHAKRVAGYNAAIKSGMSATKATSAVETAITGGRMVRGVAAGVAGAIPGLAAMMAIDAGVEAIAEDIGDRSEIMDFLEASSFRYMGASGKDLDTKYGSGFNRKARGRIAESIKQVQLNDNRYDMQELKGVLEGGTARGLFEGTQSADDFSAKFKELTTNLKSITRVLHQSLEEGLNTIKDLKEQGFRTPGAAYSAVVSADILATASGRTAAEMLSVGRQGAEMFRGSGINLATGSNFMQGMVSNLGMANNAGMLDKEALAQLGGVDRAAQLIASSSMQNMQSPMGRGILLGLTGAGGLDASRAQSLMSGNMSIQDLIANASGNVHSVSSYVQAYNKQPAVMNELAGRAGGMGLSLASMGADVMQASAIVQASGGADSGLSVREMLMFQRTQRGIDPNQTLIELQNLEAAPEKLRRQMAAQAAEQAKLQSEIGRDEMNVGGRISRAFERTFIHPISGPLGEMITDISEAARMKIESMGDNVRASLTGVNIVRKEGVDLGRTLTYIKEHGSKDLGPSGALLDKASRTYTDEDLKAFEKTGYKAASLDKAEALLSATSGSGDVDAVANKVFGKDMRNLTQEERMTLTLASSKNPALLDKLNAYNKESRNEIATTGVRGQVDLEKQKKEAETRLRDFTAGGFSYFSSKSGQVESFQGKPEDYAYIAKAYENNKKIADLKKKQDASSDPATKANIQKEINAASQEIMDSQSSLSSGNSRAAIAFAQNLPLENSRVASLVGEYSARSLKVSDTTKAQADAQIDSDTSTRLIALAGSDKFLSEMAGKISNGTLLSDNEIAKLKGSKNTAYEKIGQRAELVAKIAAGGKDATEAKKSLEGTYAVTDDETKKSLHEAISQADTSTLNKLMVADVALEGKGAIGVEGDLSGDMLTKQGELINVMTKNINVLSELYKQSSDLVEKLKEDKGSFWGSFKTGK